MSIHLTHITIQNGNNAPSLFSRDVSKTFGTIDEVQDYRRRLELLSRKRYNREHVVVFFMYKEINE